MKGIILAGGAGTRLHPLTRVVSKQLLAIYDKPMVYYPLSTLMLAGIREVLIISTPHHLPQFKELLSDGKRLGMQFSYAEQAKPEGLPQAFTIGADFIGNDNVCLILGDNIFYGDSLTKRLQEASDGDTGAAVFAYFVHDPSRYGVIEFDKDMKVVSIEEKPAQPKSQYAITGCYFFDANVVEHARSLKPSSRGETEITDLIKIYLAKSELKAFKLGRGIAWLDTGTNRSLLEASNFIATIEERQGLKVACIEEIAYRQGWIGRQEIEEEARLMGKSAYGEYLRWLLEFGDIEQTSRA